MNKRWRNIGLIALAAGVLYYPALKMYRMASAKKKANGHHEDDTEHNAVVHKKFDRHPNRGGNGGIIGEA